MMLWCCTPATKVKPDLTTAIVSSPNWRKAVSKSGLLRLIYGAWSDLRSHQPLPSAPDIANVIVPRHLAQWDRRHRGHPAATLTLVGPDVSRTTNAIERLHEEFKRRIKAQTVLPSAETAAMLLWALLAFGQINVRKVDGWQTLATPTIDQPIDLAA